jgi:putative Ca2+/H+ antiporter (TMEM165/GDT1 family)
MLESLLVPTGLVALAEIGDKTQLLALILAARFRKPWPIIAGIVGQSRGSGCSGRLVQ